ncbi:hypothetical protein V7068_21820 [Bacillus sp. JJ634]
MKNLVVYYQLKQNESYDIAVENIESVINNLKAKYIIKGVFVDSFENQSELFELLQKPLSEIDYILMESEPADEFTWQLLNELSRTENFEVKYLRSVFQSVENSK